MSDPIEHNPAAEVGPEVLSLSDLRGRVVHRPIDLLRLDLERIGGILLEHHQQRVGALVLELTARHPWAAEGYLDFYQPGRWDCEADLVYMSSIHQVGASIGEWDGTAAYGRFTAPTAGTYIVVVNFSGHQQTMRLNGPWGTNTAYTATTSQSAAATAVWTGSAGEGLYFTFSSRADTGYAGTAYLDSVQIFRPA